MGRTFLVLLVTTCIFISLLACRLMGNVKHPQQEGTVISGPVRFEFLSPTLVRLEYSPHSRFTDDASVVVVKRDVGRTKVIVRENSGWLEVSTAYISVRYLIGSGRFTRGNLFVSWRYEDSSGSWVAGDKDSLNLGGVTTLDGANGDRLPPFEPGVLSKSGYFELDDSKSPLVSPKTGWLAVRPDTGDQDWYILVYGHDYAHGLREFSELCGKIPMVPRYSLGVWMTDLNYEYLKGSDLITKYHFTSDDLQNEIARFRGEGLPLDVLVLDFGWHNFGWQGGYDWSPVFKNPAAFLKRVHEEGIHVTVNDHPKGEGETALSDEDSHAKEVKDLLKTASRPKPTFQISFPEDWRFKTDPTDTGMLASWFSEDFQDSTWEVIRGGEPWENQGHPNYHGFGWYRRWIDVPEKSPKRLYLVFGGAADQYDLYINGKETAHHMSAGNKFYNTMTYTDVSDFIQKGRRNLIALRINDWSNYGGLTKLPIELSDATPSGLIEFNLADKRQASIFMNALHGPLMKQGVDFWWIDGSGPCPVAGLNSQLWTNKLYYDFTESFTRKRSIIASRYAGWGSQRYPAFFTGDTYSEWPMLAYQVGFTARGGNVLVPYTTHDIGGFHGDTLSVKLYSRWLEFGALSPIFRLHCAYENPANGNLRMPWVYGDTGIEVARLYFNLREQLIPYIYTYSRTCYDNAMPIARPLYLLYPELQEAYLFPDEYLFGNELLVSPVVDSTDSATTYLPPGKWINYFSLKTYSGNQTLKAKYGVESLPLFVREGSIIPLQDPMLYSDERRLDTVIIQVFGPDSAAFRLYEDDGYSLGYAEGHCSWTPMIFQKAEDGSYSLSIGPVSGTFIGRISHRAYTVRVSGLQRPGEVKLRIHSGAKEIEQDVKWSWDGINSKMIVDVPSEDVRSRIEIVFR